MKTSNLVEIKKIVSKLQKTDSFNIPNLLKEVDFKKLNQETKIYLESELKKKKEEKTILERSETFPIYKEQKEWKDKNNGSKLVKGTSEYKKFHSIRSKFRKQLKNKETFFLNEINFNLNGIQKESVNKFQMFLDSFLLKAESNKIETFIGSTSDSDKLKSWKEIVSNFPKK